MRDWPSFGLNGRSTSDDQERPIAEIRRIKIILPGDANEREQRVAASVG